MTEHFMSFETVAFGFVSVCLLLWQQLLTSPERLHRCVIRRRHEGLAEGGGHMFAAQAFTGQLRMKLKSLAAATAALTLLLAGCSSGDSAAPPPAPQVTVATPLVQQVVDWDSSEERRGGKEGVRTCRT